MRNLKLEVTDRAKERILEIGPEVTVFEGVLGAGWGARQAVLVKSGAPEVRDNYQVLKEGDMSVWIPDAVDFDDDVVAIDLQGFLWMVNLVVTTAVPGSSAGGCAGCTSCG